MQTSRSLKEFIEQHGDEACARMFGVKPRTVAGWRRKERFPGRQKALEIVQITDRQVTLDGIYKQ